MARGRRPKSALDRQLDGNAGNRPPPPTLGVPEGDVACPEWLDDDARAEWLRLAPAMDRLGLLKPLYTGNFAAYCQAFSLFKSCVQELDRRGYTFKNKGMIRQRPEVAMMKDAQRTMRQFAQEFGLMPGSVGRVVAAMAQLALPLDQPPPKSTTTEDPDARHFGAYH